MRTQQFGDFRDLVQRVVALERRRLGEHLHKDAAASPDVDLVVLRDFQQS